jgi:hypothetical protein
MMSFGVDLESDLPNGNQKKQIFCLHAAKLFLKIQDKVGVFAVYSGC